MQFEDAHKKLQVIIDDMFIDQYYSNHIVIDTKDKLCDIAHNKDEAIKTLMKDIEEGIS